MTDNQVLHDQHWQTWIDMKLYGPASRWLRRLIKKLCAEIPRSQINSILDVGCGEGTTTQFIANWFTHAQVRGIDFSETGITCAKARWRLNNLEFKCELESHSLTEPWDVICAFEVLEHIADWQTTLQRMTEASQKYLLLSFPTGRMRNFEIHMGHYRNFQKNEVEDFLKSYQFFPKKVFYAGFPFFSPLYREICNLTNAGSNSWTQGQYTLFQKSISSVFYFLFSFMSTKEKYGDQFCGLFERR